MNAPISRDERCGFSISDEGFHGDRSFLQLVVDLVRDWGTSLSVAFYHQAIVHLLGGQDSVECMVPLTRDGRTLARQRFHLVDEQAAFALTAFAKPDNNYADQLRRLLDLSPLRCLHWINIGPHCITFHTVDRT